MALEGAQQVYEACKAITKDEVDLSSWEHKISEELKLVSDATADVDSDAEGPDYEHTHEDDTSFNFEEHVLYKNGILTVGCVGFPNVGKSSLMNALMGRKVVSVSKTPGHTKHFQTIFLTNTVRLCDCPGLVFPTSTPRPFQGKNVQHSDRESSNSKSISSSNGQLSDCSAESTDGFSEIFSRTCRSEEITQPDASTG